MSSSVYSINKGINKSIEYKGFKAQYIWYLGAGLLFLLILFAVLYICGLHPFICLAIILIKGSALFFYVARLSDKYGEYGLLKKLARKRVPKVIKCNSRKIFQNKFLTRQKI